MSSATKITPFVGSVSSFKNNLNGKTNGKMANSNSNDTSSASTTSNDSSSDPLESDYSEGSCEEEEVKATKRPTMAVSNKQENFSLEDLQIIKTIGKWDFALFILFFSCWDRVNFSNLKTVSSLSHIFYRPISPSMTSLLPYDYHTRKKKQIISRCENLN